MQKLILLAFTLFTGGAIFAQGADSVGPLVVPNIQTWKMHASGINEDYTIYILKPPGYDTSQQKVSVLYMTDGDWNMTVAFNCFNMLRQDYKTHEPLIVGIGYGKNENKRMRDLDPNKGAPAFLEFIEKEVMPFVESHYRVNDERGIYGYSMGGVFTTWVLFNHPELFHNVFIGAPGNNGNDLMPSARAYFGKQNKMNNKVFIGVGSYELQVVRNIDSFTTYLRSKVPDIDLQSEIVPNANHGAALSQVMESGFSFAYCAKHKKVKINTATLPQLIGEYAYYENDKQVEQATISAVDGRLYLKWANPQAIREELLPFAPNKFFLPTNEQMSFEFTTEKGKPVLLINIEGDNTYRFIKK
jgi:predicted alpha/beta superfamily hydrolase